MSETREMDKVGKAGTQSVPAPTTTAPSVPASSEESSASSSFWGLWSTVSSGVSEAVSATAEVIPFKDAFVSDYSSVSAGSAARSARSSRSRSVSDIRWAAVGGSSSTAIDPSLPPSMMKSSEREVSPEASPTIVPSFSRLSLPVESYLKMMVGCDTGHPLIPDLPLELTEWFVCYYDYFLSLCTFRTEMSVYIKCVCQRSSVGCLSAFHTYQVLRCFPLEEVERLWRESRECEDWRLHTLCMALLHDRPYLRCCAQRGFANRRTAWRWLMTGFDIQGFHDLFVRKKTQWRRIESGEIDGGPFVETLRAIEKDVPRTFSDERVCSTYGSSTLDSSGSDSSSSSKKKNNWFSDDESSELEHTSLSEEQRSDLQTLLGVYSLMDPDVGYVQGMNFVVAALLMAVGDVLDCFAVFCLLMKLNESPPFDPAHAHVDVRSRVRLGASPHSSSALSSFGFKSGDPRTGLSDHSGNGRSSDGEGTGMMTMMSKKQELRERLRKQSSVVSVDYKTVKIPRVNPGQLYGKWAADFEAMAASVKKTRRSSEYSAKARAYVGSLKQSVVFSKSTGLPLPFAAGSKPWEKVSSAIPNRWRSQTVGSGGSSSSSDDSSVAHSSSSAVIGSAASKIAGVSGMRGSDDSMSSLGSSSTIGPVTSTLIASDSDTTGMSFSTPKALPLPAPSSSQSHRAKKRRRRAKMRRSKARISSPLPRPMTPAMTVGLHEKGTQKSRRRVKLDNAHKRKSYDHRSRLSEEELIIRETSSMFGFDEVLLAASVTTTSSSAAAAASESKGAGPMDGSSSSVTVKGSKSMTDSIRRVKRKKSASDLTSSVVSGINTIRGASSSSSSMMMLRVSSADEAGSDSLCVTPLPSDAVTSVHSSAVLLGDSMSHSVPLSGSIDNVDDGDDYGDGSSVSRVSQTAPSSPALNMLSRSHRSTADAARRQLMTSLRVKKKKAYHKCRHWYGCGGRASKSGQHGCGLRWMYLECLPACMVSMMQFELLLSENIPEVYEYLNAMHISVQSFASEWFMTLFSYVIPDIELTWRIVDLFVVDGFKSLHRIGLALLMRSKHELLECSIDEALVYLKSFPNKSVFVDYDHDHRVGDSLIRDAMAFKVTNSMLQLSALDILDQAPL